MPSLPYEHIQAYRASTFRQLTGQRIKTQEEAIEYVNQRGFTYFWPIKGSLLPSLWTAVAGARPVADQHDDPGHVTWGWKDALLGGQAWYYAKVLRKKATMIAMPIAPYFYALSENFGSPEEDYLTIYEQGRMAQETKAVYEAILDKGPLDTISLRQAARLTSRASESRFNRALADLQADFKLVPVTVAQAGGWRYAFVYDIVSRHYPDIPEKARFIDERKARQKLAELYMCSVGAAQISDLNKIFRWRSSESQLAISDLVLSGLASQGVTIEDQPGEWVVLSTLL